ncbi:Katanin p80 WD40 repeat-containing subunit B1-like [Melia azedarach]|uniref:Katanin p80 WD40 repeat-containing subunit B1-like n=1 Tax=Melia azedarach TaxID=155640 RepID=A0ACC1WWX2_MELAZ|nr:Katanin p80 WD40 repeat-containing subunit B1-like [Melia azedarach]
MAKRGYKLQEFVAHSANVNCLSIGKKACRLFITGGDDHKVNLWSIGKPTSLMSLCGHTSPVESVAFDSAEVLVLAGASAGAIKLWDLEEAKMVRTLTGHRSNCTAVEFHPFGEFFASGSMDTNLKIWDIRKKGCIHTYKGHTRGINTIRFTPDGRWVVSGGFDNVVKVWDLTAGKLLHDFNFHEGHIRSIDFHPLEFLLATGSADRTVKFWDLETFELIGSSRPEDAGVRTITFHPDGRTLFCGSDDSLKVYSWEPVICHDTVDIGWSTLGDLCINDGKLLGCSLYQNSVGVWVADVSHIQPYGAGVPEQSICTENKYNTQGSLSSEKIRSGVRSTSSFRSTSPDCETKEIKTIYVDSAGGNPIASQKVGSLNSPKVIFPLDSKEISDLKSEKQSPPIGGLEKSNGQALNKSFLVPSIVPQESPAGKDSSISERESITFSRTKPGMLLRPAHVRRPSSTKCDAERLSTAVESGSFNNKKGELDSAVDPNSQTKLVSSDGVIKSSEANDPQIKSVTEKTLRPAHVRRLSHSKFDAERLPAAVESGSFDNAKIELDMASDPSSQTRLVSSDGAVKSFEQKDPHIKSVTEKIEKVLSPHRPPNQENCEESLNCSKGTNSVKFVNGVAVVPGRTRTLVERFERREKFNSNEDQAANITPQTRLSSNEDQATHVTPHTRLHCNEDQATNVTSHTRLNCNEDQATNVTCHTRLSSSEDPNITPHMKLNSGEDQATITPPCTRLGSSKDQATITPPCTRLGSSEDQATIIRPCTRLGSGEDQATNTPPCTRPSSSEGQATNSPPCVRPSRSEGQATNSPPCVRPSSSEGQATNSPPCTRPNSSEGQATNTPPYMRPSSNEGQATTTPPSQEIYTRVRFKNSADQATTTAAHARFKNNADQANTSTTRVRFRNNPRQATITTTNVRFKHNEDQATVINPHVMIEADETRTILKEEPQISETDTTSCNDGEVIENLMQTHDIFTSTLRSRLTKLQVVRHFWERKDIKGAISALRKLPDHAVQSDMISVLMEKMEILNLDLFSCLLPVLMGLLDSKMERHASISLEMLLKLVAVFGPVIHSTISAPPAVGVDLQAEQRRECCNQCFIHLQKIQKILPVLVRRGGLVAKGALELNLVLQES